MKCPLQHTTKGRGFVDGSRGGGELLVDWRGAISQPNGPDAG